jgi:hypothetical protein
MPRRIPRDSLPDAWSARSASGSRFTAGWGGWLALLCSRFRWRLDCPVLRWSELGCNARRLSAYGGVAAVALRRRT